MTLLELAMQQMHDDMVELTAALKEHTEALKAKDVIEGADPMPVELVAISEDALAVVTAITEAKNA